MVIELILVFFTAVAVFTLIGILYFVYNIAQYARMLVSKLGEIPMLEAHITDELKEIIREIHQIEDRLKEIDNDVVNLDRR